MNFAEKLLVIAENTPKVYEAGKKAGGGGCDIDHAALRQEGYNEGYDKGYVQGETTGYSKGYTEGQESTPNPLEYAKKLYEGYMGVTFPTGYELTLNLPQITSLYACFRDANGIERVVLKGNDNENVVSFDSMFRNCKSIKVLDLTEFVAKISSANMMFYQVTTLIKILGEIDFSESTNNNGFAQCDNLEEIYPKANSIKSSISFARSKNLIAIAIQAIIDGLATVETAQTITLPSSIVLTDEQKAQITSKGWTLVQ